MTKETIENPTWNDVREGDIITVERGVPDTVGYTRCTCEAVAARVFQSDDWRIIRIVREVPDPLPDHAGALAFAAQGLGFSDGDGSRCWTISSQVCDFYYASDLIDPVEALPVPAKELRELMETGGSRNLDFHNKQAFEDAVIKFFTATRREWERAGVPEPEVE